MKCRPYIFSCPQFGRYHQVWLQWSLKLTLIFIFWKIAKMLAIFISDTSNNSRFYDALFYCRSRGGVPLRGDDPMFGKATSSRYWLNKLNCDGTERDFTNCTHLEWGSASCNVNNSAKLRCFSKRNKISFPSLSLKN